ncbi:MAG: cadmium-translocating P-type ATPase [Sphingobacteriales bacterium]|nr:MAG: cadmium-translocating P-type ATPase [Sphingobacteriales bacterium]
MNTQEKNEATTNWKVAGMDCATCALSITNYLKKQGMESVKVNYANGDVLFDKNNIEIADDTLINGIADLGYTVVTNENAGAASAKPAMNKYLRYLLICLPFTLVLMLHMLDKWVHIHWLMNPWVQLGLCAPVYIIGMSYFGKSAWKSITKGVPNMNVLVALGATAAFVYSVVGTIFLGSHEYLFFETAATIITLVFLGNYLEDVSIASTQRALQKLAKSQQVMANMIAFDDEHKEQIFPVANTDLRNGDLILIKSGEQVPADCKILWGDASVNEAIITGESLPVTKHAKDTLIGGSLIADGMVKAQVTAAAKDSVLANIIDLVKKAQGDKPPVQEMADKISAIFVPAVIIIALVTFGVSYFVLDDFTKALMRSIAVLVIACPCAMGLATPAAIAVGLGRAAKNGVLFRDAKSLEAFKTIQQVVFDKTGTLTTGQFTIAGYYFNAAVIDEQTFKKTAFSLEKYSNHPIALCIANNWKTTDMLRWQKIEEVKGLGMQATTKEGNIYKAVSFKGASYLTTEENHNVYIIKDDVLVGWIDVADEIREEAASVVSYFKAKGIKTILLSGDRLAKCQQLAATLGVDEIIAEQTPQQKLEKITTLSAAVPTAMVGDGINDAPALAKATIGISMGDASQIVLQTADVVLMNHGLKKLPLALGLGKHTLKTIKQNLFWAFAYNIVAIPVAAFGFLTPTFGALVMGLSDVVLAINSVRLFVKKVD